MHSRLRFALPDCTFTGCSRVYQKVDAIGFRLFSAKIATIICESEVLHGSRCGSLLVPRPLEPSPFPCTGLVNSTRLSKDSNAIAQDKAPMQDSPISGQSGVDKACSSATFVSPANQRIGTTWSRATHAAFSKPFCLAAGRSEHPESADSLSPFDTCRKDLPSISGSHRARTSQRSMVTPRKIHASPLSATCPTKQLLQKVHSSTIVCQRRVALETTSSSTPDNPPPSSWKQFCFDLAG